ncbi:hypothetical protein [Bacillus phage BM-P1]|nr:hypothetical protein [Bacillus phage BM-P1]
MTQLLKELREQCDKAIEEIASSEFKSHAVIRVSWQEALIIKHLIERAQVAYELEDHQVKEVKKVREAMWGEKEGTD